MTGLESSVDSIIGKLSAGAIGLLGRSLTIRRIGAEYLEQAREGGRQVIYAFWHEGLLVATYAFRLQGIQVLVSKHRDGEWIARAIECMGYGTIRGSSTRGGTRALFRMAAAGAAGDDLGVTVDGPRGPRLQVKPGTLIIAGRSGLPIVPFAVASNKACLLSSWDRFMVPRPFSRAAIAFGEPLTVPGDTPVERLEPFRVELQRRLLDAREIAGRSLEAS
ncbi:MAG: lysophospholipid acyltransferase family protein [candidate division Zixibacteria bacterium]|nr:lysophospholipid acyltransferase family protein [candidate division Zixibacteria bacterium]